jgi:hypothetical protein
MRIAATFASGTDVLESYWGFLTGGGLFLPDQPDLKEGQEVNLDIAMRGRRYALRARLVHRSQAGSGEVMALAFARGGLQSSLLADAWSDAHGVPPRTFHRLAPHQSAHLKLLAAGQSRSADVIDISYGGLCLFAEEADHYRAGDAVLIDGGDGLVPARVRWTEGRRVGLEFEHVSRDSWRVTSRLMTMCVVRPLNSRD